ncbi:MAG: VanW family protein [Verrucomicrobiota bacterium]
MNEPLHEPHRDPAFLDSVLFYVKTRILIMDRIWRERGLRVAVHPKGKILRDETIIAEVKAPLWTQISEEEFPLTAGKVQNLRVACMALDGIEVPAGEVFSFWKQLGRTTRKKGFTEGRELRSGCLVPNIGGGLCQVSGLLHAAAVDAGLEVVERHEHSRMLPGSDLPAERDATVFWNYVDLRFKAAFAWRLQMRLTGTDLMVSIRAVRDEVDAKKHVAPVVGLPVRAAADGDCLTCGVVSCFRHPSATKSHTPALGHSAYLLEGSWPEFQEWCSRHAHAGDAWFTPLDGIRWKKPNYSWKAPAGVSICHQTLMTFLRSWKQRKLPVQGAVRQKFLLESQKALAEKMAREIDPKARHLVVSQTLLPHLWRAGVLGGRTFDVLVNRWPMKELQRRLDEAAARHPGSDTLVDFRADEDLVHAESEALAASARIVTPHRAIAAHFGAKTILLDWKYPEVKTPVADRSKNASWFFPASALGRKGIYELAEVFRETDRELLILGRANEGASEVLQGVKHRAGMIDELIHCDGLVIPAWVEHEPRLALRALAMGLPVIASKACGLAPHLFLHEIDAGDVEALKALLEECET